MFLAIFLRLEHIFKMIALPLITHHHELASTTSIWELQARKAAASSRCRTTPVRLLRTGLLSMVRSVTASQPVFGRVLGCGDMGRKWGVVPPSWRWRVRFTRLVFLSSCVLVHLSLNLSFYPPFPWSLMVQIMKVNCHWQCWNSQWKTDSL